MRATKRDILFLFFITWSSSVMIGSGSLSKGFDIKKKFSSIHDTALVNKFARLALISDSKKTDLKYIKAYIDSAELICNKESIEIPALLHLARADFFFLSLDFNNASQEATIALKLSEKNGDAKTMAKTMIFLGKYSLRTGLFKESIEYFSNCIVLAKKEHLRGYIPMGYSALANVYFTMGKTKEYNKFLQKLIEVSRAENDTLYLQAGFYYLGSSLTGENRNYRKADSLEFQDYKVPDSLVFRNFRKADSLLRISLEISLKKRDTTFIALSLANLGWNFYREKNYDSAIKEYN
jgi:tetratricopeptide (TPR) repeat protein